MDANENTGQPSARARAAMRIDDMYAAAARRKQEVIVDDGDLHEAMQAAEAWAGYLRVRKDKSTFGADYHAAADRIDQALHRLREQTYPKPGA